MTTLTVNEKHTWGRAVTIESQAEELDECAPLQTEQVPKLVQEVDKMLQKSISWHFVVAADGNLPEDLIFELVEEEMIHLDLTHQVSIAQFSAQKAAREGTSFLLTAVGETADKVIDNLKEIDLKAELKPILDDLRKDQSKLTKYDVACRRSAH